MNQQQQRTIFRRALAALETCTDVLRRSLRDLEPDPPTVCSPQRLAPFPSARAASATAHFARAASATAHFAPSAPAPRHATCTTSSLDPPPPARSFPAPRHAACARAPARSISCTLLALGPLRERDSQRSRAVAALASETRRPSGAHAAWVTGAFAVAAGDGAGAVGASVNADESASASAPAAPAAPACFCSRCLCSRCSRCSSCLCMHGNSCCCVSCICSTRSSPRR